ncbi:MAG: hypothetical protein ACI9FB_002888, partial [Candidatus Azotimanducaceae bacterium]
KRIALSMRMEDSAADKAEDNESDNSSRTSGKDNARSSSRGTHSREQRPRVEVKPESAFAAAFAKAKLKQ